MRDGKADGAGERDGEADGPRLGYPDGGALSVGPADSEGGWEGASDGSGLGRAVRVGHPLGADEGRDDGTTDRAVLGAADGTTAFADACPASSTDVSFAAAAAKSSWAEDATKSRVSSRRARSMFRMIEGRSYEEDATKSGRVSRARGAEYLLWPYYRRRPCPS